MRALTELAPTIGDLISDLRRQGSNVSTVSLPNVNDLALGLMVDMARGSSNPQHLIPPLDPEQVEELKRQALFLESTALADLISSAGVNPLHALPEELFGEMLSRVGPITRNICWSVN